MLLSHITDLLPVNSTSPFHTREPSRPEQKKPPSHSNVQVQDDDDDSGVLQTLQ